MPAAPTELSDSAIEQAIAKGVAEVFETMASEKVESIGRTPNPPLHSKPMGISGPHIVASVGFIGDINGIINTHFDDQLAIELSAKMLGMTPDEVLASDVLSDSTGELTNMIVGVFKNSLGDVGVVCKLTLPSIIRGSDFHLDHALKSGRRFIFNFKCRGRAVVTDIIVQDD
jgi:chemotaxis protein CheX